jgi:ribosomal protein S18
MVDVAPQAVTQTEAAADPRRHTGLAVDDRRSLEQKLKRAT